MLYRDIESIEFPTDTDLSIFNIEHLHIQSNIRSISYFMVKDYSDFFNLRFCFKLTKMCRVGRARNTNAIILTKVTLLSLKYSVWIIIVYDFQF